MGKKLEGEWVLLNLENGVYYGLNEAGSVIWDELASHGDLETALDSLQALYDAERTVLKADVEKFLADLRKEKLIEPLIGLPAKS